MRARRGTRRVGILGWLKGQFERETEGLLVKLNALDQRGKHRRSLGLRLETATPCSGAMQNRWNPIRANSHLRNGIEQRFLIIEPLPRRHRDNPFDLGSRQTPTRLSLVRCALEEVA
jgi:hypothetical protein